MSFVIKTTPFTVSPPVMLEETTMYGGEDVQRASEVFVWFSEAHGGHGLAWRGYVQSVERMGGNRMRVGIRPAQPSTVALGVSEMSPFRDVRDGSPQAELSRKLYYQSHNKIAAIGNAERAFLLRHFS